MSLLSLPHKLSLSDACASVCSVLVAPAFDDISLFVGTHAGVWECRAAADAVSHSKNPTSVVGHPCGDVVLSDERTAVVVSPTIFVSMRGVSSFVSVVPKMFRVSPVLSYSTPPRSTGI